MFLAEMGLPWAKGQACTIDRINNKGHYEIGNIKWSNPQEQANNK